MLACPAADWDCSGCASFNATVNVTYLHWCVAVAQIHSNALDDRCDIEQGELRNALVHLQQQRQGLPNASGSTQHCNLLALHYWHDPSSPANCNGILLGAAPEPCACKHAHMINEVLSYKLIEVFPAL
jgi:hypothetical protein